MRQHRALHQRGVHPAQRGDLIGLVMRATSIRCNVLGHFAANASVERIQIARRGQRLVERTEDHRKHDAKRIVKPHNGPRHQGRMLLESCGNPWMRQLEQRRAACAEEQCRFAIDPPTHRVRTEDSRTPVAIASLECSPLDGSDQRLAVAWRNDGHSILINGEFHLSWTPDPIPPLPSASLPGSGPHLPQSSPMKKH